MHLWYPHIHIHIATALILKYRYAVLFPLSVFEGYLAPLIAGFFASVGYLHVIPAYIILIWGDLVPDSVYYFVGRLGNHHRLIEKYRAKLGIVHRHFSVIERLWHRHPRKMMLLSKLAFGVNAPFLISAGLVKIPYRKYLEYLVPIVLIRYAVLMLIGYWLGHSYRLALRYIRIGGLLVTVLLIMIIVGYAFVTQYASKELEEMEKHPQA